MLSRFAQKELHTVRQTVAHDSPAFWSAPKQPSAQIRTPLIPEARRRERGPRRSRRRYLMAVYEVMAFM